jgi:hypothetical protein
MQPLLIWHAGNTTRMRHEALTLLQCVAVPHQHLYVLAYAFDKVSLESNAGSG